MPVTYVRTSVCNMTGVTDSSAAPHHVAFGPLDDPRRPLAVLVHGFPDTPHTWRHLGPQLVADGYRVVAPWLPGYLDPGAGAVTVGTYVHRILELYPFPGTRGAMNGRC